MSTNTSPSAGAQAKPERVFVPIPKAGPGQGYQAPKNVEVPLADVLGTLLVAGACLSLLVVPAVIILMMAANTIQEPGLIWLWVTMFIFLEAVAVLVALGLWREALGYASRTDYLGAIRGLPRA
jgi:hypothetical protein